MIPYDVCVIGAGSAGKSSFRDSRRNTLIDLHEIMKGIQ
jgi:pyruvate/2-oxoglutarate dehydrogenase complex dihydrolipoamide dehydrogenase (E3) component